MALARRCRGDRGKLRYASRRSAERALSQVWARESPGPLPTRAYRCERCDGWHLTSRTVEQYEDERRRRGPRDADGGAAGDGHG